MSEEYPKWMGPKGGDPIQVRNEHEVQEGWVEHFGHYDTQRGCFIHDPEPVRPAAKPNELPKFVKQLAKDIAKFDHDGDGKPGGSKPKRKKGK